ncbi:sugar-binding protein [Parapedobacter defluvii]|nr:sugar-binding protein [Parapedobacter defluvii]
MPNIQLNSGVFGWMMLISLFSCTKENTPEKPLLPDPTDESRYDFINQEEVFGFYNQSRYSYCPSLVKELDGNVHLFFCGNPEQLVMVDHIYHIQIHPDGTQTLPESVVQPGPSGSWDDHHICDPSVIGGSFRMGGNTYKYAMFYLTNQYDVYYNEVGVAFSNDLSAGQWVKYPQQLLKKTWAHEGDEQLPNGGKSWGVGQPSAVSLDQKGEVLLTYTVGDKNGTRIEWVRLNLTDMDTYEPIPSTRMVDNGLVNIDYTGRDYTCNSDFAIDPEENVIVMVRPVQPHPTTYPAYLNQSLEVNYMPLDDFLSSSGKWEVMVRIAPYLTGFARNHNAGLERDPYGVLENWKAPVVYYTVSKEAPDVTPSATSHAEWTYHIWRGEVIKQ